MGELASLAWLKVNTSPAPPPPTCTHSNGHITKWRAFDAHNSIGKSFISVFVRTNTRTIYLWERAQAQAKAEDGAGVHAALPVRSLRLWLLICWQNEYSCKTCGWKNAQSIRICVCVCVELISLGNKAPSKLDHVPNAQIAGICRGCKGHKVPPRQGTDSSSPWCSDVPT